MDKNDILDTAKTIINGERQGTYGNAEDNFANIAAFWSTYLNREISSTDVANMMILMKSCVILVEKHYRLTFVREN